MKMQTFEKKTETESIHYPVLPPLNPFLGHGGGTHWAKTYIGAHAFFMWHCSDFNFWIFGVLGKGKIL